MRRWTARILVVAALGWFAACEDVPSCREVCEHVCAVCPDSCNPEDPGSQGRIDDCIQRCRQEDPAPDRRRCLLETETCDNLWQC